MNDTYNKFQNQVYGIPQEAEDPSNPDQCMDLAFKWCDFLGIDRAAIRHQFAIDVWNKPNDITHKYFNLIANDPNGTNAPSVGSLAVFGTRVGSAGHISIAAPKTDGLNLVSLDQNWNGLMYPRTVTHYNYFGVLGWLTPKVPIKNWDIVVDQMKNALNAGGTSQDRATNADKIFHE